VFFTNTIRWQPSDIQRRIVSLRHPSVQWRQYTPLTCRYTSTRLHGAIFQKADSHLRTRRRESLKSHIQYPFFKFQPSQDNHGIIISLFVAMSFKCPWRSLGLGRQDGGDMFLWNVDKSTRCYIPEDNHQHLHHRDKIVIYGICNSHHGHRLGKKSVWIIMCYPVRGPGLKNSPTVTHSCRKRRLKWVPSAWGCSWATVSGGHKYGGLVLQVGGWELD
jgi:hypothetical protein